MLGIRSSINSMKRQGLRIFQSELLLSNTTIRQNEVIPCFNSLTFTRGKRTGRKGLQPGAQRLINMLSVFSARKKQPRRIKLCIEDLVRHNTVQAAWRIYMRDKKLERTRLLKGQYELMQEACEELEKVSGYLAFEATKREKSKRFTPELRIPSETPPTVPWQFDWKAHDK